MKIGQFSLTFVQLVVPVSGLDLEVLRTYDSRDKGKRDFGVGWTLDIRQGSYLNNRPPGDGWQIVEGFLPCEAAQERKSHLTTVKLSEREIYYFRLRLFDTAPTLGGCFAKARFEYVDGPLGAATLDILGNTDIFFENASNEVIDVDALELFEPQDVRLMTRDGRIFDFDLEDGVTRIEDPNGNVIDVSAAGLVHSDGRSVNFERDAEGRIVRITDPLGHSLEYSYDEAGDLETFTDQADATSRYSYDTAHRLLEIKDPRGVEPAATSTTPTAVSCAPSTLSARPPSWCTISTPDAR